MSTKKICLRQHFREGQGPMKKFISLSRSQNEINHFLKCSDGEFEVLEAATTDCSAILHTLEGFVLLEALTPDVSVEALGYAFDGQSAHLGFHLKPSTASSTTSSGMRPMLQLRPGETFHIGKSTFSIVPEEYSDIQGLNYSEYSQQVSQMRSDPILLSSPMAQSPQTSPIFNHVVKTAITGTKEKPDLPISPVKQAIIRTIQEATGQNCFASLGSPLGKAPHPLMNDIPQQQSGIDSIVAEATLQIPQHHTVKSPEDSAILSSRRSKTTPDRSQEPIIHAPGENQAYSEADLPTESEEDMPRPKKRKLSPPPAEESQDSLFGKSIQVNGPQNNPVPAPPIVHPKSQSPSQASSTAFPTTSAVLPRSRSASRVSTARTQRRASPSLSVEPTSSIRSTRSAVREDTSPSIAKTHKIRIVFASSTNVGDSTNFTKFLNKNGVQIVQTVAECNVLCVGKELKRSAKLISAVLLGKDLVTDTWVIDSAKQGRLQSIEEHFVRDPEREADWNFSLTEALGRGKEGLKVFDGWNMAWTTSARKEVGPGGLADLKEIASLAGANVLAKLPKKGSDDIPSTIIIGTQEDITSSSSWQHYTRDIISLSILRGRLDMESDEFKVSVPSGGKGGKKRKR